MRSSHLFPAAIAAVCLAGVAAPAFAAGAVTVHIDEATPVQLSGAASQVVVANPSIADATLLDRHRIMIMGRTYGTTNVMVFDGSGRAIYNGSVTVAAPVSNHVSFYRGPAVNNYTCAGHCERTPMPGEAQPQYQQYSPSIQDYATRAKAAAQQPAGDNQ
jgi:hypothetical protein